MKHLGIGYHDAMRIPTYERRMFLQFANDDIEQQKELYEEMRNKYSSNSKGNRSTTLSGDAVRQFALNNQ